MKKVILVIILSFTVIYTDAQKHINEVLSLIENNSITLKALREKAVAQKLGNRTGIYMSNPEIEFNYLWGNNSVIGNRQDFSIKQTFDFPSAYSYRNKIAKLENNKVDLQYKSERINILLEAKQICIEITYCNSLLSSYEDRAANAKRLASAYKQGLKAGSKNAIENNKAQMNLTKVLAKQDLLMAKSKGLLSQLIRLNGGENITFETDKFDSLLIPNDFDSWFEVVKTNSPILQYIEQQVQVSKTSIKLNKAMALPKFSAGYMMENTIGQRFKGLSLGLSIPIWDNKNKLRAAKANNIAANTAASDNSLQFYLDLKSLFYKAKSYQNTAANYKQSINEFSNEQILNKALDKGELSLLEYLMEIELFYENINSYLDTERELALTISKLRAVEL